MQISAANSMYFNQGQETQKQPKELGKDDFLKLLVTQIRYQDPLKPTEDKEFIAQLAQFSSLEQIQNLNKSFTGMANLQQNFFMASIMNQAVSLIGRQVEGYEGDRPFKGVVTGMTIQEGTPKVLVNGREVSLNSITQVNLPPAAEEEVTTT